MSGRVIARMRLGGRGRLIGWTLLGLIGVVCSGLLVGFVWLHGDGGRAWLARTIEREYNAMVMGSIRVGTIHELNGTSLVVSDLGFLDPRGRDVIAIAHARLGIQVGPLLSGKIRFERVRARGVVVRIVPGRENSTSIEDAFAGRGPSAPDDGLDLDTSAIAVEGARVHVVMGRPPILLHSLRGGVHVVLPKGGKVRVKLLRFSGRFSLPEFEILHARRFRAAGWVRPGERPMLDVRLRACLARGTIPMRVRFSPQRLSLHFDADENRIVGAVLDVIATFSRSVNASHGPVNLAGVPRCGRAPD